MPPILTKKSIIIIIAVSFLFSIVSGGMVNRFRNSQQVANDTEYIELDSQTDTVQSPRTVILLVFAYFPFWLIIISLIYFTFISKNRSRNDPRRA